MAHPVLEFDGRFFEALLRLCPALLMGGLIGLNRDLRGKPVGFRTLGLVGMGSALMTYLGISMAGANDGSASRVFQGIITGIGFLGAGVILQPNSEERVREVRGLTTAACVWVTACIGAACGAGMQAEALLVTVLVLLLLFVGGWIEHRIERVLHRGSPQREERHG
ncbi:MAG: MgtC/SapB family protein [Planctomycetes bacterium]|nr:MgtC/SapB family protein [Planctomycetota bacterium]